MKKIILPVVWSVLASTAIGTTIISCEKKDVSQTTVSKKPSEGFTEKLIPPYGSVTILSGTCSQIICSPTGLFSFAHMNHIKITKDANTIANYPANMRYSIYVLGAHVSGNLYTIDSVTTFNCTQNAPEFASPSLLNSTQYYVRITDAAGGPPPAHDVIDITTPPPCIPFTTGTDKGQPC